MNLVSFARPEQASLLHHAPMRLRHTLSDHPLFRLGRLVKLAQSLPRDRIEYNSGKVDPGVRPEDVPGIDLPVPEVIRRIETCSAWMVIKSVEEDAEYGSLLRSFLAELSAQAGIGAEPFEDPQGFIFVSSANSTTPFHVDAEENVLVQIRGPKFVHIFDNRDRALVSEEDLELSPSKHRNRAYESSFENRAELHELTAGDGVHIPYLWPHWVRTGNDWCVSMAMTWKTPSVRRLNKIRLMNGTLRRFGLPQSAPGRSPALDTAKVFAHDAVRAVIDPLRGSEGARRLLRGLVYGKDANYYYGAERKGGM